MQVSGGNRGGRQNENFKGAARSSRSRTEGSRSSWRTAGWTRGATIIFGHRRAAKKPKPQSRREIMKEITRKVLSEERAARNARSKTPPPAPAAVAPSQQRPAPQDRNQDRNKDRSKERNKEPKQGPQAAPPRASGPAPAPAPAPGPASAPGPAAARVRREPYMSQGDDAGVTLIRPRRNKGTGILALRVLKGLHAGALTPLNSATVLMVGSADDCDVILADPGVQSHHCLLSIQDGKLAVRAIDGAVKLGSQEHAPGSAVSLELEAAVILGEAEFHVTANPEAPKKDGSETGRTKAETGFVKKQLRGRWGWASGISGRLWAAGAAAAGAAVVGSLAVVLALASHPRTTWVVAPAPVQQASPVDAQERILHDVTEVLRLQGIAGEPAYTGDGTVTITGHLGDPRLLEQVIRSRAMQEIDGLKHIVAVNADHPGATTGTSADHFRIVSAISGKDPFVVTADGSRYYAGATLPQGGKLAGVEGDDILIERNGKTEHFKLTDVETGAAGPSTTAKNP